MTGDTIVELDFSEVKVPSRNLSEERETAKENWNRPGTSQKSPAYQRRNIRNIFSRKQSASKVDNTKVTGTVMEVLKSVKKVMRGNKKSKQRSELEQPEIEVEEEVISTADINKGELKTQAVSSTSKPEPQMDNLSPSSAALPKKRLRKMRQDVAEFLNNAKKKFQKRTTSPLKGNTRKKVKAQSTHIVEPIAVSSSDEQEKLVATNSASAVHCLENVFKVGKEEGTEADIASLKPGVWLNGDVINAYTEYLIQKYGNKTGKPKESDRLPLDFLLSSRTIIPVDSVKYRAQDLSKNFTSRKQNLPWKYGIGEKPTRIFHPAHHSDHWRLYVFELETSKYRVYDSLNGYAATQTENYTATLVDYVATELDLQPSQFQPIPTESMQQMNDCDCGAFTLAFAESVIRKKPFDGVADPESMDEYRYKVAKILLNTGLNGRAILDTRPPLEEETLKIQAVLQTLHMRKQFQDKRERNKTLVPDQGLELKSGGSSFLIPHDSVKG